MSLESGTRSIQIDQIWEGFFQLDFSSRNRSPSFKLKELQSKVDNYIRQSCLMHQQNHLERSIAIQAKYSPHVVRDLRKKLLISEGVIALSMTLLLAFIYQRSMHIYESNNDVLATETMLLETFLAILLLVVIYRTVLTCHLGSNAAEAGDCLTEYHERLHGLSTAYAIRNLIVNLNDSKSDLKLQECVTEIFQLIQSDLYGRMNTTLLKGKIASALVYSQSNNAKTKQIISEHQGKIREKIEWNASTDQEMHVKFNNAGFFLDLTEGLGLPETSLSYLEFQDFIFNGNNITILKA